MNGRDFIRVAGTDSMTYGQQSVETADAVRELLNDFRDACDTHAVVREELVAGVAKVCEIRKLKL